MQRQPQPISSLLTTSIVSETNKSTEDFSVLLSETQARDRLPTLTDEQVKGALVLHARFHPKYQQTIIDLPYRAFTAKVPTLGAYAQTLTCAAVRDWIIVQLNEAAKHWGSKDSITYENLQAVAVAFLAVHQGLNPPEVMLYFAQLTCGFYGKVAYGQVKTDDLLQFMPKFYEQRNKVLHTHYEEQRKLEEKREAERNARYAITYEQYLAMKVKEETENTEIENKSTE